jgi:PKD repeat protein
MKGILIAGILLIVCWANAYGEIKLWNEVSPNGIDVEPGEYVDVTVWVADVENLFAAQIGMYYDPAILSFDSLRPGTLFEGKDSFFCYMHEEGYILYGETLLGGGNSVTKDLASLVIITFKVIAYGMVTFKFDEEACIFLDTNLAELPFTIIGEDTFNNAIMTDFVYSPEEPMATEDITFDGSPSKSNCGEIISYIWDFGDGTGGEGMIVVHAYAEAGSYTVSLLVTDEAGYTISAEKTVTVSEYVEPAPEGVVVDLVRRGAWPEHHHFDISSDEDTLQTLFGKIQNMGNESCYVKVRFDINGEIVESDIIELAPGEITGRRKSQHDDLKVLWGNYVAGKKYTVYAQAFGSMDLKNWTGGATIKKFSFAVVE